MLIAAAGAYLVTAAAGTGLVLGALSTGFLAGMTSEPVAGEVMMGSLGEHPDRTAVGANLALPTVMVVLGSGSPPVRGPD